MVVDIGGGTTDIAIFDQGSLWFSVVLPVGGDYITSDLAVGLRTPLNKAEELKKTMGCTLPDLSTDSESWKYPVWAARRCIRSPGK